MLYPENFKRCDTCDHGYFTPKQRVLLSNVDPNVVIESTIVYICENCKRPANPKDTTTLLYFDNKE